MDILLTIISIVKICNFCYKRKVWKYFKINKKKFENGGIKQSTKVSNVE